MLSTTSQHLVRRLVPRRRVLRLVSGECATPAETWQSMTRAALATNPRSLFTGIPRQTQDQQDPVLFRIQTDLARGQFVSSTFLRPCRSFASATPRASMSSTSNNKTNSGSTGNVSSDQERKLSSISTNHHNDNNDHHEETYREKAEHYRDQAREGAKSFGGLMKQYGPVFFGTYMSVYVATLGSLFGGVQSGVIDPAYVLSWITGTEGDIRSTATIVAELLEKYSWTEQYAPIVHEKPYYANLAVAWLATKLTEPLRLGATAVIVRPLAKQLGLGPYRVDKHSAEKEDAESKVDKSSKK